MSRVTLMSQAKVQCDWFWLDLLGLSSLPDGGRRDHCLLRIFATRLTLTHNVTVRYKVLSSFFSPPFLLSSHNCAVLMKIHNKEAREEQYPLTPCWGCSNSHNIPMPPPPPRPTLPSTGVYLLSPGLVPGV